MCSLKQHMSPRPAPPVTMVLVASLVTLLTIVTVAASSCVTRSGDQGQCRRGFQGGEVRAGSTRAGNKDPSFHDHGKGPFY